MPRETRNPVVTSAAAAAAAGVAPEPVARPNACLLCKRRKLLCDRKTPCSTCVRAKATCVPTTRAPYNAGNRRRRRQAAPDDAAKKPPQQPQKEKGPAPVPAWAPSPAPEDGGFEPRHLYREYIHLWSRPSPEADEGNEDPSPDKATPDDVPDDDTPKTNISTLFELFDVPHRPCPTVSGLRLAHPQPVHTFVLWQTFLQNVHPLSKIVHAPQVQELVVHAAAGFDRIPASSVPLLFAVYAAAVTSLSEADCRAKLGETKPVLLDRYLGSTQRALVAAGYLRVASLALIQAFTLLLMVIESSCDAQTLWLMSGVALRMVQRLRVPAPVATAAKVPTPSLTMANSYDVPASAFFETQMHLRVWWFLMMLDGRAAQMCGQPQLAFMVPMPLPLLPGTDPVPLPANLNDSDMHPQMTGPPPGDAEASRPTEMVFVLLRYELGRFLFRHGAALQDTAHQSLAAREALVDAHAARYETHYLRFLDPALPLHQAATAMVRAVLAKLRLMLHHPGQYRGGSAAAATTTLPQAEHDLLFATSVDLVDVFVQGLTAPAVAHFAWHMDAHFQLDATVFMLIEVQNQPVYAAVAADTDTTRPPMAREPPLVDKAWRLVADVLRLRPALTTGTDALSAAVRQLVRRAWAARARKHRVNGWPDGPQPPESVAALLRQAEGERQQQQKRPVPSAAPPSAAAPAAPAPPSPFPTPAPAPVPYRTEEERAPAVAVKWGGGTAPTALPAASLDQAASLSDPSTAFTDADMLDWQMVLDPPSDQMPEWELWSYWDMLLHG